MRSTFVLNSEGQPVSAIRRKGEAHIITIGTPFTFARPYETIDGTVEPGAHGSVTHVDQSDGTLWIKMSTYERALLHWDNMIALSPYDTEDLTACVVCREPPPAANMNLRRRLAVAAALAAAFFIGMALQDPAAEAAHIIGNFWGPYL